QAHELLRGVKLVPERGEEIHSRMRFPLQENGNILSRYFQTNRLFQRQRGCLVGRLCEHRGETEELALVALLLNYFLLILVEGRNPHFARDHHVCVTAGSSGLVNTFPWTEGLDLNLTRQDRSLVIIQQRKQWNTFEYLRLASHGALLY